MNFDVCVDMVFQGEIFSKALEKTKEAGITSYEFWSWWDKDIKTILERQKTLNMKCISFCTKFVTLLDPLKRQEYKKGLEESIKTAKDFDVKILISQVGNIIPEKSYNEQWDSMVTGLRECDVVLKKNDITLVVEPLNLMDHPGYFLTDSKEAFRLIKEVDSKNVKLLYDIYHFQVSEGNLIQTITEHIADIGHFHCAGNPGRGNITKGEINYAEIFRIIQKTGYEGYMGLEGKLIENRIENLKDAKLLFDSSK
ncbi:TIM barrel protein [Anaerocolumna sp. MB42-C2]|uniref:TIM barrel protein n=1 Tax=Anaerocolumna sp. MB42-C2 TaxID=3070997 RepID=UPI0027DFB0CB|nr:TIM barrel protein [Anaerocolumna sp. MB42-C2]WMJ88962.1 TIM barrel protein [Anaerocolumna sp. MB42-C2]